MSEQDADTRVLRVFGLVSLILYAALALFFWTLWSFRKNLIDCVLALSGAHLLSFTFLRRKAIGYFVIATLLPILFLVAKRSGWTAARLVRVNEYVAGFGKFPS